MLYVIIAAVVVAAGLAVWAMVERMRASKAVAAEESQRVRAEAEASARTAEAKASAERLGRMELLLSGVKGELSQAMDDLAACRDPAAIRDRLNKLLSGVRS